MNLEILTPEEIKNEIENEEQLRKKEHFKDCLKFLVFTNLKQILRHIIKENILIYEIERDLYDVILSNYFSELPSKTLRELLEEKGWKVHEITSKTYGLSFKNDRLDNTKRTTNKENKNKRSARTTQTKYHF